MTIMTSLMT